jgi:hypothetical protein
MRLLPTFRIWFYSVNKLSQIICRMGSLRSAAGQWISNVNSGDASHFWIAGKNVKCKHYTMMTNG